MSKTRCRSTEWARTEARDTTPSPRGECSLNGGGCERATVTVGCDKREVSVVGCRRLGVVSRFGMKSPICQRKADMGHGMCGPPAGWAHAHQRAQRTRPARTSQHLGRIDLKIEVGLCSPTHSQLWSGSVAHGDCAPQFRVAGDLPSKGFPLLKNCM